jgi:hypothetical protein
MVRLKFFAAVSVVLSLYSAGQAQENYATWTYRKDITFNTSATGANVTADVIKVPVLVRLTPANGGDIVNFSVGRGADIRFTKTDGVTRLHHQIDRWDSATQVADVWVLMDTVKGNSTTQTFRVYWGRTGAADSSKGSAVFDTANGYAGVWHLGNASAPMPRPNAIAGRFAATPVSFAPGYFRKPGVIGFSDSLTGGSNADSTTFLAINEGTPSNHFNFPAGQFSYSAWIFPGSKDNFARLISLVSEEPGADRIFLAFSGENLVGRVWGTASHPTNSTVSPTLNEWSHVAMTVNRGPSLDTTRLYHNGAQIATSNHNPMTNVQRNLVRIGKDYINTGSDMTYNGRIDEARLSHVTRSANYIKFSYENQKPGSTVLTYGAATPATPTVPAPATPLAMPSGLNYTVTTANYTLNTAITTNTATVTGAVDSFTVVPALPAGLVLNKTTGAITGTPTAAAPQRIYTVVARNEAGTSTRALTITVTDPTSIRPGGFVMRVSGSSRPYTFAIAPAAVTTTEALTMSISGLDGRTIWIRTVNPARDGVREVSWNGHLTNGGQAPAGMYTVRVTAVSGGKTQSFIENTVTLKAE